MTISSLINENTYVGAGSTDTFSYNFLIFVDSDLLVTQRDDNDAESLLVLDVDYTVTGVGDPGGGTIVLTAGNLTTGYALTIRRVRPLTQETDIRNLGDSFPETIEDAFDDFIMIAQQLQRDHDRTLILPETTTGVSMVLPEPIALKWPRINAAGTGWEWVSAADFSTLMTTVDGSLTLSGSQLKVTNPVLHCVMGGAVNALTGGVTPAPASLTNNLRVYAESLGANTSTTPTFKLGGLVAKTIVKEGDIPLLGGDIGPANSRLDLIFDSSLDKWVLMNPLGGPTKANIQSGAYLYAAGAGAVNVMTAAFSPTILALTEGMVVRVKVNLANTTTTPTLNIDTLGAKTIKRENGAALIVGDLPINYRAIFQYTGSAWILLNPALVKNHTHTSASEGGSVEIGIVIQAVHTADGEVATGTTIVPQDDTIPQNTEGDEYMTLAITPTNASNKLVIEVVGCFSSSAAQTALGMALFQDSVSDALAISTSEISAASRTDTIYLKYEMVAGTTDPITFKMRAGGGLAGTTTFNGSGGTREYGGIMSSCMRITEYKV